MKFNKVTIDVPFKCGKFIDLKPGEVNLYWFLNSLVALRHRVTPDADEIFIVFENQNISITGEDEHVIVQSTNGAFEITWGISYSDGGENPTPHISVSEYTIPDGPKGRS